MSEEMNKTDLKDEDLKKVTGGGTKVQVCNFYTYRDQYETCPNTAHKGKTVQCSRCPLK